MILEFDIGDPFPEQKILRICHTCESFALLYFSDVTIKVIFASKYGLTLVTRVGYMLPRPSRGLMNGFAGSCSGGVEEKERWRPRSNPSRPGGWNPIWGWDQFGVGPHLGLKPHLGVGPLGG